MRLRFSVIVVLILISYNVVAQSKKIYGVYIFNEEGQMLDSHNLRTSKGTYSLNESMDIEVQIRYKDEDDIKQSFNIDYNYIGMLSDTVFLYLQSSREGVFEEENVIVRFKKDFISVYSPEHGLITFFNFRKNK